MRLGGRAVCSQKDAERSADRPHEVAWIEFSGTGEFSNHLYQVLVKKGRRVQFAFTRLTLINALIAMVLLIIDEALHKFANTSGMLNSQLGQLNNNEENAFQT